MNTNNRYSGFNSTGAYYSREERKMLNAELEKTCAETGLRQFEVMTLLMTHGHSEIRAGKWTDGVFVPKDIIGLKIEHIFYDESINTINSNS